MQENCWMVQLKPLDKDDRNNSKLLEDLQKQCIGENYFGMGWPSAELTIQSGEKITPENEQIYLNCNGRNKGRTAAFNCYKDMRAGDLVITRLANGKYYIAMLTTPAEYIYYSDKNYYDYFSWGCKVDCWKPVEDIQILPAIIRGKYSSSYHNTVIRINNESESYLKHAIKMIYERLTDPDSSNFKRLQMKMDISTFTKCLDYKELEDLVYLYMLDKHPDYILLPSTCKVSQPVLNSGWQKTRYITLYVK